MSALRIGISGWTYAPWRGSFFPKGLPHRRELEFASRQVNSIEINGSFYSLQRPQSYQAWYDATPEGFLFSVKGGRFITHLKRLNDVEAPLANFFASGLLLLREKLGPILWQLPPSFRYDREKLESFFALLPRDTEAAAALARHHDHRLNGRSATHTDHRRPIRYALEVRHPSFVTPEFIALLRAHRIALVVADTAGKWPFLEDVTGDFVYVRLHGDKKLYVSGYTPAALKRWEERITAWSQGQDPKSTAKYAQHASPKPPPKRKHRDVFVYFDNDVKVRAPYDTMNLAHLLGLGPKPSRAPKASEVLETRGAAGLPSSADGRLQSRNPLSFSL